VDASEDFPELSAQLEPLQRVTRGERTLLLDAQELSERLFGDHMPANTIALGAAYQRGLLPVSAQALERAIRLNGAAVERNLAAFAWGRACVAAPDAVEAATCPPEAAERARELGQRELELVDGVAASGELRRLLEVRVPELVAYQSRAYAERYVDVVRRVKATEEERIPGSTAVTEAVARNLFKLMAYKDEYEVARLHLDAAERARLRADFRGDVRVAFNLHPPLLRALGVRRKLKLGGWFVPFLRLLRGMRRLRGTPLDLFGYTRVRRTERALIREYEDLLETALAELAPDSRATAIELCELPDVVRGYEEIKLRNVERFRERAAELRGRLAAPGGMPAAPL
jgi:indolepyruvate ferredoxin oxidoreductase